MDDRVRGQIMRTVAHFDNNNKRVNTYKTKDLQNTIIADEKREET